FVDHALNRADAGTFVEGRLLERKSNASWQIAKLRSVGSESIGQAIIAGRSLDVRRQHDECPIWLSTQVKKG
ncbi:hypothetical protein, partial [Burkholderia cepacia]|uniref:hypothetical protein n=1 Tax=Burkholderia cepacia TaxID=292 RepID=UPI002ABE2703